MVGVRVRVQVRIRVRISLRVSEGEHRAKQHVRVLLLRQAWHDRPDEAGHHEDGDPSKDEHQAERDGDRGEHRDRRRVGQCLQLREQE